MKLSIHHLSIVLLLAFVTGMSSVQAASSISKKWIISNVSYTIIQPCNADQGTTFFAVHSSLSRMDRILSATGEVLSSVGVEWSTPPTGPSEEVYFIQQPGAKNQAHHHSTLALQSTNAITAFIFNPSSSVEKPVQTLSFNWTNIQMAVGVAALTEAPLNTLLVQYRTHLGLVELRSYSVSASTISSPAETFSPVVMGGYADPPSQAMMYGYYSSPSRSGNEPRQQQHVSFWIITTEGTRNQQLSTGKGVDVTTGKVIYENADIHAYSDVWSYPYPNMESGVFFYTASATAPSDAGFLMAFDAIAGRFLGYHVNAEMGISITATTNHPTTVIITSNNGFFIIDALTGKSILTIPSDISGGAELLFDATEALLFSQQANNTLISLSDGGKRLNKETLPWQCYTKHMPVERVCDRPDTSARTIISSSGHRFIFTSINPVGETVLPTVLDGTSGDILAVFTPEPPNSNSNWVYSKSVIAVSPSSQNGNFVGVYCDTSDVNTFTIYGMEFTL